MEFAPGQFNESVHFWTASLEAKNDFSICEEVVWVRLTRGMCTCINLADWNKVKSIRWHTRGKRGLFYAANGGKKGILLHNFILSTPENFEGEHKDRNGLHNLRSNLRAATHAQNSRNRSGWSRKTLYKGVYKTRFGKFQSFIRSEGRGIHLGNFASEQEAAKAYDVKAKELFGEFARLNSPVTVESN